MRAMILAAGFGTRLGELTQLRPKPMLPICGAPLVRWAVLWLRAQGVREIVINLHYLGEQIIEDLGDGSALEVDITYSHEEGQILGTGGGLRQARRLLDDGKGGPFVVVNGKILTDLELAPALARHRAGRYEATMVLREDSEGVWGGSLAEDQREGSLATFLGETRPGAAAGPAMMFTGVHLMQSSFLDRVPPEGEQCIVRTAYRQLFREDRVGAHIHRGYWWEHSTVERYLQGVANVLDGKARLAWAEAPVVGVHPDAIIEAEVELAEQVYVGPGARVGRGAVIGPHSQIGAGASVAAGVRVERAAVWPGVQLERDLCDAVCTGA
ncbi:NDP-sugar synthase [Pseudenhygromyxa sp. WMMC2535]|uniref:nucleotidyltransferase family protein n=1 Tax=Pseudenhygromyxa sp. WMMC2535 TaxID=2712867 RepID=UPI0015560EBF|nr:NDP-sugar synthase [Pseudenhygromyxa sp. WMMC2535]NVB37454.1 NDP-sugar synthase [Pseudenhygromyxa sp. WMMC2535]